MTTQRSAGMRIAAFAASDVGRVREQNEDSLYKGATLFAVADGMGGHQAGEIASGMALQPVEELDGQHFADAGAAQQALVEAITEANRSVVEEATANPERRGMGTTLTAVMVRDGRLHVAHVGDSRAYLLRDGERISQLTTDHTLVEQLIQEGRLSRDEASTHPQRSVITRAIGVDRSVQVDSLPPLELQPGDQVLLCSDGLTGPVEDAEIADILADIDDGDAACRALIDAANDSGGPDNITVVLLRVSGGKARASGGAPPAEDATANLHETTGRQEVPPEQRVSIRTREESGQDWATSMGRYGAPQGVNKRTRRGREPSNTTGGRKRLVAGIFGALVLIAILILGGWFLLSRAFFVGDADGTVAIFQGVPQEVAGISLHRVHEDSDLATGDLSVIRQQRLATGITVGSVAEGRRLIEEWRADVEDQPDPEPPAEVEIEPDPDADAGS
jgi:PPM family protein phosphatase